VIDKFLSINKKREVKESKSKEKRKRKQRKYVDSYLDFGFTYTYKDNVERPQSVVCLKVLAAESMLPNKLKHHLITAHSNLVSKPHEYLSRKLRELNEQTATFSKRASIPATALLASNKVAYRVAKCKKTHTIAEKLILPSAVDMVTIMVGDSAAKQLLNVPLSNNTITHRIYVSEDINDQLIEKLKYKHFGIQLDKETDNNNDSHLICYVRFIDGEDNIVEDLLFCKSITAGSKAVDLFETIDSFMDENSIDWTQCVGVCTDGARSMLGRYGGPQALIRNQAPDAL
jgi:hypothetical protein